MKKKILFWVDLIKMYVWYFYFKFIRDDTQLLKNLLKKKQRQLTDEEKNTLKKITDQQHKFEDAIERFKNGLIFMILLICIFMILFKFIVFLEIENWFWDDYFSFGFVVVVIYQFFFGKKSKRTVCALTLFIILSYDALWLNSNTRRFPLIFLMLCVYFIFYLLWGL